MGRRRDRQRRLGAEKQQRYVVAALLPVTASPDLIKRLQYAASTTHRKPQLMIPPMRALIPHPPTPTATTTMDLPAQLVGRGALTHTSIAMTMILVESVAMTAKRRSRGGRGVQMHMRRFRSRRIAGRPRWACVLGKTFMNEII